MSSETPRFFVYVYGPDLAAMRHFYTSLLGLAEIFHEPGPEGGLGYHHDGVQFTIFESPDAAPCEGWARQPGWQGGERPVPSWSIALDDTAFSATVERLAASDAPSFAATPRWVGYWSFPVRDPAGHTVEITCPERSAWSD